MSFRRAAILVLLAGLVATGAPTALSATRSATATEAWTPTRPTYRLHDDAAGRTRAILPPGENGLVDPVQLLRFEATGTRPAASQDQLRPYERLLYAKQPLTDAALPRYYLDESFGIRRGAIRRTETPMASVPVVIYRDRHDIPHIYGGSLGAMAYGAGYAAAEDRLFLMDVLRHYGEGDLASFVGPSCSIEQMDHDQLLSSGYTAAQRAAQVTALPGEYGRLGRQMRRMIDGYVAGINRYIARTRSDPSLLPADYAAAGQLPADWTPGDVVAVISLIGIEATGGGAELQNAALLQYLQHRLGTRPGRRAFAAFKQQNDPAAPTTIRHRAFPYMTPRHVDRALTAMPDRPGRALLGAPADTTPGCGLTVPGLPSAGGSPTATAAALAATFRPSRGESNALLVGARRSADHHPIAVFGPELGYYAPQILMEEDLHAPGYDAEGAAFPGASMVVTLGRGRGFAFSATTASTDQIDVRITRLCNPDGGPVAPEQPDYVWRHHCRPMSHHTFSEVGLTKPGGTGAPAILRHQIYATNEGIVQGWTTVRGRPVAVVHERATFGHEPDSLVGLLAWGEPSRTHSPKTWVHWTRDIAYSFNWLYVDSRHIAYSVSGRDPVRDPHVDPNLPSWATYRTRWRGWLPAGAHPHQVDPRDGYLVSWNNKPAPRFSASDDMDSWGPVQRSQLLTRQLTNRLRRHHRLQRAQMVAATETAATQDLTAIAVLPPLLHYLGRLHGKHAAAMERTLRRWLVAGAHRRRASPGTTQYRHAAAIAIWDQTYPAVVRTLFDRIFAAGGVSSYDGLSARYDAVPTPFAQSPNNLGAHAGDGYYVGWEGYLVTALHQLAGDRVAEPFPAAVTRRLCGRPGRCHTAIRDAFTHAYRSLRTINHTGRVNRWTADTATVEAKATMPGYDEIRFEATGIVGQPDMPWVNRPTYQQVAEFVRPQRR